MNERPTFRERALYLVNPKKGNDAYNARLRKERAQEAPKENQRAGGGPRMSYASHGASSTLNSLIGCIVDAGNAEDSIDLQSRIPLNFKQP